MRRIVLWALLCLLAVLPSPGAAQPNAQLQIELEEKIDDPEGTLNAGRVVPSSDINIQRLSFAVKTPPLAYCTDPAVRMEYEVVDWPSVRVQQPSPETRQWTGMAGVPVSLDGGPSMTGFSADVRVWVHDPAPAFTSYETAVVARAFPAAPSPNCSFTASDPFKVPTILIVDYVPKLQLRVPPEPWLDAAVMLEAENRGNGDSRLFFEFGTPRGDWVPLGVSHVLEAPMREHAVSKNTFALSRIEAPTDWTGEIRVRMASIYQADGTAVVTAVADFGAPPPIKYPDESLGADEATDSIEDVPGWGAVGTASSLASALFVRRRRFV